MTAKTQDAPAIVLVIREDWFRKLTSTENQLYQQLAIIKNDLFSEYGVVYPSIEIQLEEDVAEPVALHIGGVAGGEKSLLDLPAEPADDTAQQFLVQLKKLLSNSKVDFITPGIIEHHLTSLQSREPDLVQQALDRLGVSGITEILRSLIREGIMIRDLVRILTAIVDADFIETDSRDFYITDSRVAVNGERWTEQPADILKCVRASLRDQICYKFAPTGQMPAVLVDNSMEQYLTENFPEKITEEERRRILADVEKAFEAWDFENYYPILFTDDNSRPMLWEIISPTLPHLRVLAYSEISPYVAIHSKGNLVAPR